MTTISQLSELDLNASYNYADYLSWQFNDVVELIQGKIHAISPAPNVKHQSISWQLSGMLFNYFNHKPCHAFAAPFDVRLYDRRQSMLANHDITTVVQPDICVICDDSKLDEQGCNGAPDWIIEILSKGNSKKDVHTKHALYAECGVTEYWLVFPYEEVVQQFILASGNPGYQLANTFADNDLASSYLFPDFTLNLSELFTHN